MTIRPIRRKRDNRCLVGHGLLGVCTVRKRGQSRPIRRRSVFSARKSQHLRPSVRVRNGNNTLKMPSVRRTAYQAHKQGKGALRLDSICPTHTCEFARPIRRNPHGLLGARFPGLLGAETRPIRRTKCRNLVEFQRHVVGLTV